MLMWGKLCHARFQLLALRVKPQKALGVVASETFSNSIGWQTFW